MQSGPMTYHPRRFGGVQIRDNGRAIGSMHNKFAAKALCDAINAHEKAYPATRQQQDDTAWAAHQGRR